MPKATASPKRGHKMAAASPAHGHRAQETLRTQQQTTHKTRKEAKRAVCPQINQAIMAAAERDLPTLVSVVAPLIPQMNLVNFSTAWHRLARASSSSPDAPHWLRKHTVLQQLLAATSAALGRASASGSQPRCQALSNIAWAMATLQVVDLPLLDHVAALASAAMASFRDFELSSLLQSLAKLCSLDPRVRPLVVPTLTQCCRFVSGAFCFESLVMAAWSFAAVGIHDAQLFRDLGDWMLSGVHSASSSQLASIVWAFKEAGAEHDRLLSRLECSAAPVTHQLPAEQLVDVPGSCAAAAPRAGSGPRVAPPATVDYYCQATEYASSSTDHCSSYTSESSEGNASEKAAFHECITVLSDCFACSYDVAAAMEFRRCAEEAAAKAARSGRLDPLAGVGPRGRGAEPRCQACTVRRTFIEVCDGLERDDEELEPPLDFIRHLDVDLEKLAAYRASYRKFRSGAALGAKGEVRQC